MDVCTRYPTLPDYHYTPVLSLCKVPAWGNNPRSDYHYTARLGAVWMCVRAILRSLVITTHQLFACYHYTPALLSLPHQLFTCRLGAVWMCVRAILRFLIITTHQLVFMPAFLTWMGLLRPWLWYLHRDLYLYIEGTLFMWGQMMLGQWLISAGYTGQCKVIGQGSRVKVKL